MLHRSEERSWRLHRQLSSHLNSSTLEKWRPNMLRSLIRLRTGVRGQPHLRNLNRWQQLIDQHDLSGLHQVLTGLDRESVEMREVSPMSGQLSEHERAEILALVS